MNKPVKTKDLFDCKTEYLEELFFENEYSWEILNGLKEHINNLIRTGIDGFEEISEGVLVGKNVRIYPNTTIEAPAIIGDGCEVRPGAFLRGYVVTGKNCVIGNSSELKHCVLLDNVQVPHYNYVGDSILGNYAHMGAGAICSNLKADGKNVVIHSDVDYETGLRKIGAILGDKADVGCGCVLNPGTIIGMNTNIYPLTSVRGVIPENSIVKKLDNIVDKIEF